MWHELPLGISPIKINREILKVHGCDCQHYGIVGCDAVQFGT